MADNKHGAVTPAMEQPVKTVAGMPLTGSTKQIEEVKPKDAKPKSKGFSNPALRAMGIPTIRLPSRNWMIFWTVVAAGTGGIIYDRYQQKQIRKKWVTRVSKFGEQPLDPHTLARKITVYIAPPPSDYLDESMAIFRRYVKPILNSAGIDYNIQSENRQGVIRATVAAEIRSLRREILENEKQAKRIADSKKWYNRLRTWLTQKRGPTKEEEEALANKRFTDGLKFNTILGVFYENERQEKEPVNEDAQIMDPTANGGVLCIGRGAYKEYLHGVHEGLLGPLEKPIDHTEMADAKEVKEETNVEDVRDELPRAPVVQSLNDIGRENTESEALETTDSEKIVTNDTTVVPKAEDSAPEETKPEETKPEEFKPEETKPEEIKDDDFDTGEEDEEKKKNPIPKPFISPEDYPKAELAPELNFNTSTKIPTQDHVSPVFQQPILVIPVYHLLGFLSTPQRIYRFYTRRYLSEDYGKATVALVENLRSPFKLDHVDWAKDEEEDWPKKWVEKGKAKNSEWTQELVTDERVLSRLTVYDADRVTEPTVEK